MTLNRPWILLLLWAVAQPGAPLAAQASSDEGPRIERINFIGNRTDEAVLRRHLPLSEGDILRPGSLEAARESLFNMRQFKKVDISSAATAGGGAAVSINLRDGWYIIPFPFFMAGSGGAGGGAFVSAKNIFHQAESIALAGMFGKNGRRLGAGAGWEGWAADCSFTESDYSERQYTDGGFSTVNGMRSPADQTHPGRYGTVLDDYGKRLNSTAVSLRLPLIKERTQMMPQLSAAIGWEKTSLGYAPNAGVSPADAGRQGQMSVGLQFQLGHGRNPWMGDGLGAMLGFGMADIQKRIQPLPTPIWDNRARLTYYRGERWTGSDFSYGYGVAGWDTSYTWGSHRSLTLSVAGGHGDDLPPNRLLATGRETGLQGNYAREFRGDSAMGGSLGYSHPFRITRRGIWQGTVFAEGARAWFNDRPKDKAGVGASFWYRFWRFPLPLGVAYTYSIDNRDSQFSGAIGGRF